LQLAHSPNCKNELTANNDQAHRRHIAQRLTLVVFEMKPLKLIRGADLPSGAAICWHAIFNALLLLVNTLLLFTLSVDCHSYFSSS